MVKEGVVSDRFGRTLGILLFLQSKRSISAAALARRFEVSTRTIHRDLKMLEAAGVPLYAERGRDGGFRLVEGYVLPPLMFSRGEAIAVLLGLTLLRRLQARPFPAELDTVERKILAAVPPGTRATMERAEAIIGVEALPDDIFHPELDPRPSPTAPTGESAAGQESATISVFLQAILDDTPVRLHYRSPYRAEAEDVTIVPLGLLWDRDRWYLAGRQDGDPRARSLWRADRVTRIKPLPPRTTVQADQPTFDIRGLLGRQWLRATMDDWRRQCPVTIHLSRAQATRLQRDWYYHHARFERVDEDTVAMTFGEDDHAKVMELLRWLGPGAELMEPAEWREIMRADLSQMLAVYGRGTGQP